MSRIGYARASSHDKDHCAQEQSLRGPATMRLLAIVPFLATAFLPAKAVELPVLHDVSQEVLVAYQTTDVSRFQKLLAPQLQAKYAFDAIRNTLLTCRSLTGQIERIGLPAMGARRYGFFIVYTEEAGTFDMVIEIDQNAKIIHFLISKEIMADDPDQVCLLNTAE